MNTLDILTAARPVMPVIVIEQLQQAKPLAHALYEGGIRTLEVTLRSECALEAIKLLKETMPTDCFVGAGTVLNGEQFRQVVDAGADFAISPGINDELIDGANESELPFLPGVATASEVMKAVSAGFTTLKFFPAEQSGGVAMLKALSGPFPEIHFCPTGGIGPRNYRDYLSLPSVTCVGGSWITPQALVRSADWTEITSLAKAVTMT